MRQPITPHRVVVAAIMTSACLGYCSVAAAFDQQRGGLEHEREAVVGTTQAATDKSHAPNDDKQREPDRPAPDRLACDPETVGPEFSLDVGGRYDADRSQPIFLLREQGVSGPRTEPGTGRHFRALDPRGRDRTGYLEFRVNTASLALQANGVPDPGRMPRCDAIVDIEYQDVVNERNCFSCDDVTTQCRPRLYTRLDFGDEPETEWWAVIGPFAGLGDGKWKTARFFLEATPWQMLRALPEGKPRSAGPGRFQFRIAYPEPKSGTTPLPIGRISLRFVDRACFDKLREADRAARTLERKDHVESNTIDRSGYPGQSYVLYQRNYLQKIYANTVPESKEILGGDAGLEAFEIRGETEPVTFSLYAFEKLDGVQVEAGTLVRRDGRSPKEGERADIPSRNIRIRRVVASDKRWAYDRDPYYGLQPWWLDDVRPFAVAAGTSQQVWVSIDVPADAAPGTYAGELRVSCASASSPDSSSRRLPLTLTVYDIALEGPDVPAYLCHSPYTPGARYAKTPEIAARSMAALGVRSVNTWMCPTWDCDYRRCRPGHCPVDVAFPRRAIDELDGLRTSGVLDGDLRCVVSDARRLLWEKLCLDEQGKPTAFCSGPCPQFDKVYVDILSAYKKFYNDRGVQPVVAFVDEPGNDPTKRREAEHMNRLAQRAGLTTQVTYYYPICDEPLAGWRLRFFQPTGGVHVKAAPWRRGGLHEDREHLTAYWDFAEAGPTQPDLSGHGNTGTLRGPCRAGGGELELEDETAHMEVKGSVTLDISRQGTVSFWFRPDEYSSSCMAPVLRKGDPKRNETNYGFFFYGSNVLCAQQGLEGLLQFRAAVAGSAIPISGEVRLAKADLGEWCNITWVYDASRGGTMYVNGASFSAPLHRPLSTNGHGLVCGSFKGAMAEITILNRAVTPEEISDLVRSATDEACTDKRLTLSVTLPPGKMPPSSVMTFALGDTARGPAGLETTKRMEVNGEVVWERSQLDDRYGLYKADLGSKLRPGEENVVRWVFVNGYARQEELCLYLVDDFWREAAWAADGSHDPHWTYSYAADPAGDLGPMAPHLDEPIFSLYRMNQEALDYARRWPGGFSFYAPYITTQPVIVNNRFLYGLYASALGAKGALVYAYADWAPQPWDDEAQSEVYRMGGSAHAIRGCGGYQLILPSWEDRIYETVIYESLREGIEDSRIIATLKRAVANHPGRQAQAAQEFLNRLFAKPSPEYHPRYWSRDNSLPIESYADRSAEILSDLADGDTRAYGVFDGIRRQMIEHILALDTPAMETQPK